MTPTRRAILAAGFGLTLELAALPALAASDRRKLVFVICRGGLDGLSLAPPVGDPDYAALRGAFGFETSALRLDDRFALHPALESVYAMAKGGQARLVPAVATPDRARSHFEAQDVLESGATAVYGASSGWLNRAVGVLQARSPVSALSVGPTAPLVLRGPAPASSWTPGFAVDSSARLPTLLQDLYRDDPLLGPALARGLATEDMARAAMMGETMSRQAGPTGGAKAGAEAARKLGQTTAGLMRETGGPRVVALSLDGFDTHANQVAQLAPRLAGLDALLEGLRTGLGEDWRDTLVVVATEFGRTARINGTGGTDHGTASTALVLGGGLKPGGIVGDWPGLRTAALFENRDLAPSLDMRALFKGALAAQFGLEAAELDTTVFPDSAGVRPVSGLV
jgi:uncharacterized protein (DUF1501 family)